METTTLYFLTLCGFVWATPCPYHRWEHWSLYIHCPSESTWALSQSHDLMMPYPHRGQKCSGQAGLEQLGAASYISVIPTLQDTSRGQSGVPCEKRRSQRYSRGRPGSCCPAQCPHGVIRHCPQSSQHPFCSKAPAPKIPGEVGMRTQGSCCPAPGTEDTEGKLVSPPDRGCLCCTGLRLFSAMTLARSWDWGPADFTSCRFCSRIYVERQGESKLSVQSQAVEFGRAFSGHTGV